MNIASSARCVRASVTLTGSVVASAAVGRRHRVDTAFSTSRCRVMWNLPSAISLPQRFPVGLAELPFRHQLELRALGDSLRDALELLPFGGQQNRPARFERDVLEALSSTRTKQCP